MRLLSTASAVAAICVSAAATVVGTVGVAGADAPDRGERIISGTVADPAAWPSIGALVHRSGGVDNLYCGATVIAPRVALTAAHCVFGEKAGRFSLIVGRPDLSDTSVGQEIRVKSTRVHPGYAPPGFTADYAILKLREDALVPAAILPSDAQGAAATVLGAPVRVAGWGGTKPDGRKISDVLLTTSEAVIKPSKCKREYEEGFSAKLMICVKGNSATPPQVGRTGSCYGDSGGPLMADTAAGPLLVGLVSGGGALCATKPEYYALVSAGLGFIRKTSGVVPPAP